MDNPNDNWLKTYWRPAMGWQYFVICMFDFLIAPILNAMFFALYKGVGQFEQWDPLTLKGAGLYHIAMGAIIGVTAWSRGQEKMTIQSQSGQTRSSISLGDHNQDTYNREDRYRRDRDYRYDDEPPIKGGPFR
jgi:hypothetical protein